MVVPSQFRISFQDRQFHQPTSPHRQSAAGYTPSTLTGNRHTQPDPQCMRAFTRNKQLMSRRRGGHNGGLLLGKLLLCRHIRSQDIGCTNLHLSRLIIKRGVFNYKVTKRQTDDLWAITKDINSNSTLNQQTIIFVQRCRVFHTS